MKTVIYNKDGMPINEFEIEDWVERFKESKDGSKYTLSTSLPFDIIRREIACGNIDPDLVIFAFKNKIIKINRYGAIKDWPRGFCDKSCDIAEEIIKKAIEIRQNEQK